VLGRYSAGNSRHRASEVKLNTKAFSPVVVLLRSENAVPKGRYDSEITLLKTVMHAVRRPSLLQPSEWNLVYPRCVLQMVKNSKVAIPTC
jgi:hypothetical protein